MGTYYNPLFGNRKRGFCSGTRLGKTAICDQKPHVDLYCSEGYFRMCCRIARLCLDLLRILAPGDEHGPAFITVRDASPWRSNLEIAAGRSGCRGENPRASMIEPFASAARMHPRASQRYSGSKKTHKSKPRNVFIAASAPRCFCATTALVTLRRRSQPTTKQKAREANRRTQLRWTTSATYRPSLDG